jgi:two-component system, cell cycle sensor histidine kinase and response regulator CckA
MGTHGSGKQMILLAEDTNEIRHMVAGVLCQNGYSVLEAGDGLEALEISDSYAGDIDMLITDLMMPRLSGMDLIRTLKSRRPDTRVLAISGWTNAVLDSGTVLLQKPFTPAALLRKIDEVIAGGTSMALSPGAG